MKNRFKIIGQKKLCGNIDISGSKNVCMSILIASILSNKMIIIRNIPIINDVKILIKILKLMGSKIFIYKNICYINNNYINKYNINFKIINKIRSSILLLGPIISKFNKFITIKPGGCKIGNRPINLHIKNIKKFNIDIKIYKNKIFCNKKNENNKTIFKEITMEKKSVGVTLNIIFLLVISNKITIINNCSLDIEILETIKFLNYLGSNIKIFKNKIVIFGVKKLKGGIYDIIYDRIELGTFIITSCISRGIIKLNNIKYKNDLKILIYKLKKIGHKINIGNNYIKIIPSIKYNSISIKTKEFPGFPTDLQPFICLLNILSNNNKKKGIITENIFENRLTHINQFIKMKATFNIINKKTIICNNTKKLYGHKKIITNDLRSSATLIIAACIAEGESIIYNIDNIYRGYEDFEKKLIKLGANIKKI
ncbi:UDP-N-acetylglucosamine 1-carboxyvinyltransferase [Candidatus Nardonella dryophthoridicola]|uniref:UDP-N-acetylglucosamine 1-carboxyvinyltransferase n=1 Tax=endosymbiont of Rhynchophorus ferrugineus TaxID=1972133 RepID=A0A2Z5TGV2_9GAMM|nr:UDP-N-acetylglucosamine 1-carboxyvinyltransferase [Candidatus Nardonella dryophthoridicola]BBA85053.1 UDP-N-acetylglucosamine 1-carboxyvinyltransferase [endosymbiont of Rhynchophorus ferrugineus]